MKINSGPFGVMTIGGVAIPVTSWSLKVDAVRAAPSWWSRTKAAFGLRSETGTSFNVTMTWDFTPWVADLESLRWSEYLTRQFRGQPGMRFADLMRGVERN